MLVESGTHLDAQNDQMALTLIQIEETRMGRFGPVMARICDTIVGGGFPPTEVSLKRLSPHAIDYGDKVRISDLIMRKIRSGDDFDINRCANLHLSDAAAWRCSGRTSRVPSNHRAGFRVKELRQAEDQQAEESLNLVKDRVGWKSVAKKSLIRDVMTPHHDRDYRAMACLLLPHIRTM